MALREILARFGVEFDGKQLEQGNRKVEQGVGLLKGFGAALATAFAVDRVKSFTLGLVEQADAIGDQAALLNMSSDALQQWQFVAGRVEISGEALTGIFTRLSTAADKADEGGKGVAKTLKDLGVNVEGANGQLKDSGQLFEEVGLALGAMPDKTEALSKASQIFGRMNAAKIVQVFKEGGEGVDKLRARFHELGGGIDKDFVEKAGVIDDQMKDLDVAWTSAKTKIVGLLLPALTTLFDVLTKGSIAIRAVLNNTNFGPVIAGLAGITAGALALSKTLPLLKHWKSGLALILAEDLYTFATGGDSLFGRMLDGIFGEGAQEKVRAFGGKVFAEVRSFFANFSDDMKLLWKQFTDDLFSLGGDAFQPIVAAWKGSLEFFWDLLTGGVKNRTEKVKAMFDTFGAAIDLVWIGMKGGAMIALATIQDKFAGVVNTMIGYAKKIPFLGNVAEGIAPLETNNEAQARASFKVAVDDQKARIQADKQIINTPASVYQANANTVQNFNFYGNDPVAPASIARVAKTGANNGVRTALNANVQRGGKQ